MLLTLLAFALALGTLIIFHELGHFWVARACGVRVLRFSIGFGPVLLHWQARNGTQWAISAIPLGGYVKMQDETPPGATSGQHAQSFNHKPLWQRTLIVLAGPAANLVLAAVLYAALSVMGGAEPVALIGPPPPATVAAQAGLQGGETLVGVAGRNVESWAQLRWSLLGPLSSGQPVLLTAVDAQGQTHDYELPPLPVGPAAGTETDPLSEAGLMLAPARPRITEVLPGGAGEQAGLQAGDLILQIESLVDPSPEEVIQTVQAAGGQQLALRVERGQTLLDLRIVPRTESTAQGETQGRIAVMLAADRPMVQVRHGILESSVRGVTRSLDMAVLTLKMMGRMLIGEASWANISGPVTIADYAGQTARAGLASYLGFMALISVSIGVLNLLPIPMLDGGHLMFFVYEAAKGRPPSEEWRMRSHRLGAVLLISLMGLAFFNDFIRVFS